MRQLLREFVLHTIISNGFRRFTGWFVVAFLYIILNSEGNLYLESSCLSTIVFVKEVHCFSGVTRYPDFAEVLQCRHQKIKQL